MNLFFSNFPSQNEKKSNRVRFKINGKDEPLVTALNHIKVKCNLNRNKPFATTTKEIMFGRCAAVVKALLERGEKAL